MLENNEYYFTVKIDETSRLRISLNEEQMRDLAKQIAEILRNSNVK